MEQVAAAHGIDTTVTTWMRNMKQQIDSYIKPMCAAAKNINKFLGVQVRIPSWVL